MERSANYKEGVQVDAEDLHTWRGKNTNVRWRPAIEKHWSKKTSSKQMLENTETNTLRLNMCTGVITKHDGALCYWSGEETRVL